jgi:hypothetical protein
MKDDSAEFSILFNLSDETQPITLPGQANLEKLLDTSGGASLSPTPNGLNLTLAPLGGTLLLAK